MGKLIEGLGWKIIIFALSDLACMHTQLYTIDIANLHWITKAIIDMTITSSCKCELYNTDHTPLFFSTEENNIATSLHQVR